MWQYGELTEETARLAKEHNHEVQSLYALPGAQNVPKAVAYLDLGTGGYMDIGTDLTDESLASLPKGRHMLGIVGTYGVDGYVPAQPAPSVPTALLVAVANLVAQMEIVSRVGFVDTPNDKDSCAAFCVAEGTWLELMSAVESLASALAAAGKAAKRHSAQPAPSMPEVTDAMALAFHHALTDGSIGAREVEEIKDALRAALAAAPEAKPCP